MNPKPNFEQYKADQERLEAIPTIKSEFHFVINDISKKVLAGDPLTDKEIDDLEMIYHSTQDLEKELVVYLDDYRSRYIITKLEFLITSDYFLTAYYNGPDSKEIKDLLMNPNVSTADFKIHLQKVSVPEYTRKILADTQSKIGNHIL